MGLTQSGEGLSRTKRSASPKQKGILRHTASFTLGTWISTCTFWGDKNTHTTLTYIYHFFFSFLSLNPILPKVSALIMLHPISQYLSNSISISKREWNSGRREMGIVEMNRARGTCVSSSRTRFICPQFCIEYLQLSIGSWHHMKQKQLFLFLLGA